jgi:hypothetical protein
MSIDFQTLQDLSGGKSVADAACPMCGPYCKTPSNRTRKVLRIYNKDEGFSTFKCQRCGKSGYAHASNRSASSKSVYDEAVDIISVFQQKPAATPDKQETDQDRIKMIRSLWRRSVPARRTIVETYLRTRRCWVDSETVRYLPPRGDHLPALIVPFGLPTEPEPGVLDITTVNIHGVQLTKLKPDGSAKADVETKKMTLGQCVGYPIVLAPPNDLLALVIAEGVEDALTAHVATGRGAWASGGAGRLPALADKVPSFIEHVTIMTDDDNVGRKGANELGSLLQRRSIEVELLLTPRRELAI